MHTVVEVDTTKIDSWDSFHDVFTELLGFPGFYGRNMNAWIDCLTSIDEPDDGLTKIHVPKGGVLVLALSDAAGFAARCPEIYDAVIECSAFVNYRRLEVGEAPVIALSFWRQRG
jgi:hypothetical protein